MNYLDLFSGCGGFRLGIKQAGIEIDKEFHSDIDKYANQTYKRHFPESEELNDIRNIKPVQGRLNGAKINLITFGFPCQDVSVAGRRAGLKGDRTGLFYEATRLIRELKPEIFIFENVKGLFSSNEGADFTTVLREIADIGLYDCEWQLLNTRWFLPQNRERLYFIGHLRGKSRPKVFPIGKANGEDKRIAGRDVAYCIDANYHKGTNTLSKSRRSLVAGTLHIHNDGKVFRATSNGDCPTISVRAREYESGQPCIMYSKGHGFNKGGIKKDCGALTKSGFEHNNFVMGVLTPDRGKKRQNGPRFKKDESFTLTTQDRHGVYDGHYIRRLTPVECCRLHGFPDDWVSHLSDTQAYKQMGNTVSPVVVKEIFTRLGDIRLIENQ